MVPPSVRAAIGFCCCLILRAQAPPGAVIAGVVLDGGNGQAIRRAIVTLSTLEARPRDAVAWTDATGRFAFGYLPAGPYELRVVKTGYQTAAYGAESPLRLPGVIQLAAGEIRNDLMLRLQVVSLISGTVTDEDGDPLASVEITVLRPGWQRGKRRLLRVSATSSDSSGRYRLDGLPAGGYVIEASAQFGIANPKSSEVSAPDARRQDSYIPQFYPGTDLAESASPLSVKAGQEYPDIDFHLRSQPDATVQGRIVLPPGAPADLRPQITATAVSPSLSNPSSRRAGVMPDLTFRFGPLPRGAYLLTAAASSGGHTYSGAQEIDTSSGDAHELVLALEPGIDVSGSVTAEGAEAARSLPAALTLVPAGDTPWSGPPLRGSVAKDGSFTIAGVPPGVWDINPGPIPPGVYIKSMHLGDQDVLTEEMAIRSSTRGPLKIVLGSPAATVQGEVATNGPAARPTVLLAPEARLRHVSSFYRSVATGADGHFRIENVTPGTYQLFAFDEFDRQSIEDPEFLKPFEADGVTVTVKEGENPPQKLSPVGSAGPHTAVTPGGPQ